MRLYRTPQYWQVIFLSAQINLRNNCQAGPRLKAARSFAVSIFTLHYLNLSPAFSKFFYIYFSNLEFQRLKFR